MRFLCLLFALVTLAFVPGARADVVTLETVERLALEASPAVRARDAHAEASRARVESTRRETRPGLYADVGVFAGPGARIVNVYDANTVANAVASGNVNGASILAVSGQYYGGDHQAWVPQGRGNARIRYEGTLYDFGRTGARVDAARATAAADAADARAERETVLRGVRAAYLAWYGAYARRVLLDAALQAATERARAMEAAATSGARALYDVDTAAVEVVRLELELARARAAERDAKRAVELATSSELAADAEPDPAIVETTVAPAGTSVPSAVAALSLRSEAALASGRAYRLRFRPILTTSVQVGAFYQFQAATDGKLPIFPSYSLTAQLTVPLYDPRASRSVESDARARAAELESLAQALVVGVELARVRAAERYESAAEEVRIAERLVALSTRAAEGAEQRWRTSGGSIDTVLSARERERRAREELVHAQLDRTDAALRLRPVD